MSYLFITIFTILVIDFKASYIPWVPKPEFLIPLNGNISGPLEDLPFILIEPESIFNEIS